MWLSLEATILSIPVTLHKIIKLYALNGSSHHSWRMAHSIGAHGATDGAIVGLSSNIDSIFLVPFQSNQTLFAQGAYIASDNAPGENRVLPRATNLHRALILH